MNNDFERTRIFRSNLEDIENHVAGMETRPARITLIAVENEEGRLMGFAFMMHDVAADESLFHGYADVTGTMEGQFSRCTGSFTPIPAHDVDGMPDDLTKILLNALLRAYIVNAVNQTGEHLRLLANGGEGPPAMMVFDTQLPVKLLNTEFLESLEPIKVEREDNPFTADIVNEPHNDINLN